MIVITGGIVMKPECRDAAIALGAEHSARSRAEPGCLAHNVHVDAENASRLVFFEQWADMAAVTAHFAVPESGAFVRDLAKLANGAPWMRVFEGSEVEGMGRG